jgi:hypothetical protein
MIIAEQEEEPEPTNAISIFFNWLYPRCPGGAVHEIYVPGRGFVGRKFERNHYDIERFCFKQNFNRERFTDSDNLSKRPRSRNVLCDKTKQIKEKKRR